MSTLKNINETVTSLTHCDRHKSHNTSKLSATYLRFEFCRGI